jgi:hypothetical protein
MIRILQVGLAISILAMDVALPASPAFADSPEDESDPLTVLRMFTNALDAGNIDSALSLLEEENPVFSAWLAEADYDHIELSDVWISENAIDWTVRIYNGDAYTWGIGSAIVDGGKIKRLAFTSW